VTDCAVLKTASTVVFVTEGVHLNLKNFALIYVVFS